MRIPAQTLTAEVQKTIESYTERIVKALRIRGPYNIQYLVKDNVTYVIECNLRASRSMPYVSKTRGINLIEIATQVMLGQKLRDIGIPDMPPINHVGVKVPQFSFLRLSGADPVLGVEMLSTGEVACLGENFEDALSKALSSAGFKIPPFGGSVLITVGGEDLKKRIIPLARELSMNGLRIYATYHTAEVLGSAGISNISVLHKVREPEKKPNIADFIREGKIDLVINIPSLRVVGDQERILKDEYMIRRLAVEFNVPILTNLELALALARMLDQDKQNRLTVHSLDEYFRVTA